MDILTRWAKEQIENPEIILNIIEGEKVEARILVKRKKLIEKIEKTDKITPGIIDYFKAKEISIEKDDILKIMNTLIRI